MDLLAPFHFFCIEFFGITSIGFFTGAGSDNFVPEISVRRVSDISHLVTFSQIVCLIPIALDFRIY